MRLVRAKKALGQHFLKDLQIAQRIADTLSEYKGFPILEVGPGMLLHHFAIPIPREVVGHTCTTAIISLLKEGVVHTGIHSASETIGVVWQNR